MAVKSWDSAQMRKADVSAITGHLHNIPSVEGKGKTVEEVGRVPGLLCLQLWRPKILQEVPTELQSE